MSYLGLNTTTDDHAAKASPADVRRKNRQLIFRLLFPTNQYSRAELGRRTGLSRVAVSDVVGRMLEEGLLRETGQAPSGGKGKRGTLLSIDIDRLRIISIDLTQEHLLHGAVTNLLGHISIDLDGPLCPCGKHGCLETMISGTALKKQLSAADVEQHQGILARAGRYLGQALSMPVGLLDMADVCVYGQPNIINETFIDAAQQYLDAATSSSFHKHTVIRRCECGPDITVQGEAIAVVFQHLAK